MSKKAPPIKKIRFFEPNTITKPKIITKAPSEQTLKPSVIPKIIARIGKEKFKRSTSPIKGILAIRLFPSLFASSFTVPASFQFGLPQFG